MQFNSWQYAVFLVVVFAAHWLLKARYRWFFLLLASYFFYMSWNPAYAVLILLTTVVSYYAALGIERRPQRKKQIAAVTALICLGVLGVFKYFNFFARSVSSLLSVFSLSVHPVTLKLLLPVGISFYTFQTLSYVLDVYRGLIPAEKHFGYYAVFVSFFPQLVAGPIERPSNLLPQLKADRVFNYEQATYGLKQLTWGLFKKMAVADILAPSVDAIFNNVEKANGAAIPVAMVMFSFQIYCDFSGYSDIAIGTAKLFGINLMQNFKSPYFAGSIRGFWSRWHISLSTWFRDYLYIPLGGNRKGFLARSKNLLITFLASGLWHGANWTFVIWGGIHGLAQIVENALNLLKQKHPKAPGRASGFFMTALVFVFCTLAWTFFRANQLSDVFTLFSRMFNGISSPYNYVFQGLKDCLLTKRTLLQIILSLTLLTVYDFASLKTDVIEWVSGRKAVVRYLFYVGIVTLILFFRAPMDATFVYFQF